MKKHIITSLAIISLFAASCGTSRHAITASVRINDTVVITVHDTFTLERERVEKVYVHDTIIITPAAKAEQTMHPAAMVPGVPYTTRTGHARNTIKKDTAGNISAVCECDSVKTMVRALTETTVLQAAEINRLRTASTDKKSFTEASYQDSYKQGRSWVVRNWKWLSTLIICLCLVEIIYRRFIR